MQKRRFLLCRILKNKQIAERKISERSTPTWRHPSPNFFVLLFLLSAAKESILSLKMARTLLLFLFFIFSALHSSNAQVRWFDPSPQLVFPFGGDVALFSNGVQYALVCGVDESGDSHMAYLRDDGITAEFLTPGNLDGTLNTGSTFPLAGQSCSISVDNIMRAVAWNGIATTDGNSTCNQARSIAFYGEYGQLNPGGNMIDSATIAPYGTRGGAVTAQRFFVASEKSYRTYFFFTGINTNLSVDAEVPCKDIYNAPGAKRQSTVPYRFDIYMVQWGLDLNSNYVLQLLNHKNFFATNDPLQGLAHSAIVTEDFNEDDEADMFVCGTVYNTATGQDQPFTQLYINNGLYNDGNNGPTFVNSGFAFPQLTHCTAISLSKSC